MLNLNYIKLFWFKPGSSREEVFDEKYGKQYEVMTDFCFGVNDGNTTLKGQTAIDRLMQPDWDGEVFAKFIPIIPDAPSPVIKVDVPQNHYPDDIPIFRSYDPINPSRAWWYRGYNELEGDNNGRIWYNLPTRNEEDLKMFWDYLNITHWEDPQISDDESSYYPNPEYDIWLAERERLVTKWQDDISRTWSNGCQLIFVGTVIFPVIPDTPDTKWRLIMPDGTRVPIPVEVGKYSADKKFRVRKVVDFETGNRINSYNMLVNNATEVAKSYSPEKAIQYLTGVVRHF